MFFFYLSDNPLECDCTLRWYREWLKSLHTKDDDANTKKRTLCTMTSEHREYKLQDLPLERMNCVGKNLERTSSSDASERRGLRTVTVATALATVAVATVSSSYHCL
jgi:hypothetical protein